jgi:glycosyltransferase involved in cell wall biosynthesis
VEPANPQALAEKIRILAEDRDKLIKFSDSAYTKSKSFKSWDQVSGEIYEILSRIS